MTQSNAQNCQPHILLVEDDPAIATSLKVTFKREDWQLTWLDNVSAVLPKLKEILAMEKTTATINSPPLSAIILDVGLPDGDGLQLCQSIRNCDDIGYIKNLPILFLTARSDEVDRILGLEMGGDDYCPKPFSPRELIARIKAIWRRQEVFDSNIHSQISDGSQNTDNSNKVKQHFSLISGEWTYHTQTYQLYWQDNKLELSNTERNLLLHMIKNPNQVFSREQLLSAVTEHPDHRLARTVDSHVKSIRKILATVNADVEVVYTHRGLGYGICTP